MPSRQWHAVHRVSDRVASLHILVQPSSNFVPIHSILGFDDDGGLVLCIRCTVRCKITPAPPSIQESGVGRRGTSWYQFPATATKMAHRIMPHVQRWSIRTQNRLNRQPYLEFYGVLPPKRTSIGCTGRCGKIRQHSKRINLPIPLWGTSNQFKFDPLNAMIRVFCRDVAVKKLREPRYMIVVFKSCAHEPNFNRAV
ncbi:hypothetical protein BD310DRAFT_252590 [Dichomitus squalens]|uniref:Uncharacterized protein n=1 Tax=Dichomitus squalens TaxID=114155 RepID=A0A4Q9Q1X2_9APHY|nr:hypothetical protein BD310DRAFT_252590 [Dichomitus squalens]